MTFVGKNHMLRHHCTVLLLVRGFITMQRLKEMKYFEAKYLLAELPGLKDFMSCTQPLVKCTQLCSVSADAAELFG